MKSRAAPPFGVVMILALLGVGTSSALSLRSSAAESFLGDVSPGSKVVYSEATGARLRLENTGHESVGLEMLAVPPPKGGLKDGYEPWPYPDRVRLELSRALLDPGEEAQVEIAVTVPKEKGLAGGQYQFDVQATAKGRAGASLRLKTRVLMSIGPPLARAEEGSSAGFLDRPGFTLSPPSATLEKVPWGDPGGGMTVKIVNAGDEDLTVSLTPAREWDASARTREGFAPAPNPRWLRFESSVVKVRAGAIGSARIGVVVPRQARYAGRRWAFVAAVDAVAGGRRTRRYFVLNMSTRELEEETQAP